MSRKWKILILLVLLVLLAIEVSFSYWYPKKSPNSIPREPPPIEWFAAYSEACQKHGGLQNELSVCEGLLWNLRHCSAELSEADKKRIASLKSTTQRDELLEIDLIRGLVKNLSREGVIWPYGFVSDLQRDRLMRYLQCDKPTSDILIKARLGLHEIAERFQDLQQELKGKTIPESAMLLRWAEQSNLPSFQPRRFTTGPLIPAFDSVEGAILDDMARFWNLPQARMIFEPMTYPLMQEGEQILIPPTRLQKYTNLFAQRFQEEQNAHPQWKPLYEKFQAYLEACSGAQFRLKKE